MTTLRVLLSSLVVMLLVACATGPGFQDFSGSVPPVQEGYGRVWIYRPSKVAGAALQPDVLVDNKKVGKAQPGAFFYVDLQPGAYEITCAPYNKMVKLESGATKYIKLALMWAQGVFPQEVDEATALKEIQECRLITADGANKDLSSGVQKN